MLGLGGILVIARRGELGANLLPMGVDVMVPMLWQVRINGGGGPGIGIGMTGSEVCLGS